MISLYFPLSNSTGAMPVSASKVWPRCWWPPKRLWAKHWQLWTMGGPFRRHRTPGPWAASLGIKGTRLFPKLSLWVDSFGAVCAVNRRNQVPLPPNYGFRSIASETPQCRATRRNLWESDSTPCPDLTKFAMSKLRPNGDQLFWCSIFWDPPNFQFPGLILSAYALVAKPSKLSAELHQRIEAARTGWRGIRWRGEGTAGRLATGGVAQWNREVLGCWLFNLGCADFFWFLPDEILWLSTLPGEFQRYHWYNCVPFRANGCFSARFPRQVVFLQHFMLQDLDANKDSLRLLCFFCDAESAISEEDESHAIEPCYIDISYIIYHISYIIYHIS